MNHKSSEIDFHCIPWSADFIDQAVSLMCTRYGNIASGCCDLHRHLVVLPSDRACRDFESQLSEYATRSDLKLMAPRIVTPVKIPGFLFLLPSDILTESHALLLATSASVEIKEDEPVSVQLRRAARLIALRRELSSACVAFEDIDTVIGEYDVPDRVREELDFFKELNALYLGKVVDAGLVELDAFLLNFLRSPRAREMVRMTERVHLLACTELKEVLVRGISYSEAAVSVYVYAHHEFRERFDDWGRLIPARWKDETITIPEDSLMVVDQNFHQISAVSDLIAQTKDSVTIVACDRSLSDLLKRELIHEGYDVACSVSAETGDSSLVALIDLILKLAVSGAREIGNLLFQHPDILRWFDAAGQSPFSRVALSREWDAFLLNHLPGPAYSLIEFFSDDRVLRYETLAIARRLLAQALPVDVNTGEFDVRQMSTFLVSVYGVIGEEERQKQYLSAAIAEWNKLQGLEGASDEILLRVFSHWVKDNNLIEDESSRIRADHSVLTENASRKIKIVGWLDSSLDRSGTIFLTSVNEGIIPEPQRFDYLLPDTVREKLGLQSRRSRASRDKYVLMSILGTEKSLKLFASRTFENGEGALLSRLVLSQSPGNNARLILDFFESSRPALSTRQERRIFRVLPRPLKVETISVVPVSGLTAYKACPYRFYLRYVLGITPDEELPREIDGAGFGRIVHQILKDLLLYERQTGSETGNLKIQASRLIDDIFDREFGSFSFPAVSMQMDRLRVRIERFLEQHRRIRDEGWKTVSLEERLQGRVFVPGRGASALPVRGQIDRIDIHRERNEARIYDYKTGEGSRTTHGYHMKKGEIVNFQLPAYKHLLERNRERIGIGDMKISVAIYNISAQMEDVACEPASWSAEEYSAIDVEMFDILGKIHAGEFSDIASGEDSYSWLIS